MLENEAISETELRRIFSFIDTRRVNCWERDFLISIKSQFMNRGYLTTKQINKAKKIHGKYINKNTIANREKNSKNATQRLMSF